MTTRDDKEAFLDRWSRVKREAKDQPPQKAPENAVDPKAPPPELPPVDKLTPESDFRAFFHPKVDEDTRRAALKKLFSDPRFNVMDGLDVYIDDYSKSEPIPAAMLAGLRQAQNILQSAKEDADQRRAKELQEAATQRKLESPAPHATPGDTQAQVPDSIPPAHPSRSTDA